MNMGAPTPILPKTILLNLCLFMFEYFFPLIFPGFKKIFFCELQGMRKKLKNTE